MNVSSTKVTLYGIILSLTFLYGMLLSACESRSTPHTPPPGIFFQPGEAISFLGDTLHRPDDDDSTYHHKDSLLQEAIHLYETDSNDLQNIIWYGRRLAYLHRYQDAIATYTRGISIHPDAPELYRHRGHRYITLRKPDEAIHDLMQGIQLAKNRTIEVEPDGIPNKLDIPLSNLHFNLYYHLGLAYYLKADYSRAIETYRACLPYSVNPDLQVAVKDWLFLCYWRTGDTTSAKTLLADIHPDMEIIENDGYLERLLLYKGELDSLEIIVDPKDAVGAATLNYGIACWYELTGRESQSASIRQSILRDGHWPAFGYIAAEADSARRIPIH